MAIQNLRKQRIVFFFDSFYDFLKFLGTISTIIETLVIIINLFKKIKANKTKINVLSNHRPSMVSNILWIINPKNVFK